MKQDVKGSPTSVEDELVLERTRSKVFADTLQTIKSKAEEEAKRNQELVWYARNRCRYPNHSQRFRLEQEHSKELES